ncbi:MULTISPECIES: helix-turn-helix transcriptional regulator [unclassified Microcoleus]|uniref:helix-turn-helix domain-containing protein n=2 Tax=unclassified Microcoleus TaxID=2642155 RepID=UPI002FD23F53
MNIQNRQKLSEIIKTARGTMSQRAFGKLLGVSATAVQLWERGDTVPDTENLAKLAARAGYTLEEFLRFLDGKPVSEAPEINDIVKKIQFLPLGQVALIGRAVADRFAAAAEVSGD